MTPPIPPNFPAENPQTRWYYSDENGQVVGPLSLAELKNLAAAGILASTTYVYEEGVIEWLPFSETRAARSLREPAFLPPQPETPPPATSDKPEPLWLLWLTKFIEILAIIVAGIIRGFSSLLRSFANATAGEPSNQPSLLSKATPQAKSSKLPPRWLVILFLIIFFPIGLLLLWLSSFTKLTKIIVTAIFAILVLLSVFSDKSNQYESSPSGSSSQASDRNPVRQTISWEDVDEIYNLKSDATNLQKKDAWGRFKDKQVTWSGEVSSISDGWGGLTMQVKMNPETFVADLLIKLKKSERQKASRLRRGDSVTFTARLVDWGTLLPITLDDGELR